MAPAAGQEGKRPGGWANFLRRDRRPPMPGRLVEAGGLRLHLEEIGSGHPGILMVHGYLGSTGIWYTVAKRIARTTGARVLLVDLPGAGYSDKPPDAPYTLPWLGEHLHNLVQRLRAVNLLLVGHSLGGAACLHALARHPRLARALVLVSPLVFRPPPPPGLRLAKKYPGPARVFFQSVGRLVIPHLVKRALYGNGSFDARASARLMVSFLDAPGGWEAATRMGLRAHDYSPGPELLSRVTLPTLVIWGGLDSSHDPELAKRLHLTLGGHNELVVLPRAGHNCHEEEPGIFTSLVAGWFHRWKGSGSSNLEHHERVAGESPRQYPETTG